MIIMMVIIVIAIRMTMAAMAPHSTSELEILVSGMITSTKN